MKTKLSIRRGFTLVELLVVIVIIAALAGLTAPMVLSKIKKADQAEAVSNARQIGIAMFEFQADYGSYPDTDTASLVDNTGGYSLGTTNSNNYFQQLFAAGLTQSEAMFYAKTGVTKKSDGNITGTAALAAGEVGFGYVLNTADGLTASGNPAQVIVVCPLKKGGEDFNSDIFDKKAVLLRIDNSVTSVPVVDSKAMTGTGVDAVDVFLGGANTPWGTDITPTIVPPSEIN